jgi:ABC-type nitrate/sulfonate/bicarbonate transport system substrate-binding protein
MLVAGAVAILAIIALTIIFRPRPFTVSFQPAAINYPMIHAIEGKFFENQGLKPAVQQFTSANDALDALLGGSTFVNAAIPLQNLASIQQQRPNTLGIFALVLSDNQHPLSYLVVPSKSNINSASDLQGKTIVVFPGSHSETLTRLTLNKIGVSNVTFIKRAPSDMPKALQGGDADAGILYDPVATQASLDGWGRIVERAFWENHLLPVLVVGAYTYNMAEAEKNPETARRVFAALEAAIADAKQNPRNAKMVMKKYLGVSEKVIDQLPNARVELARDIDPKLLDQTVEIYAANGIITGGAPDLKGLLRK